MLINKSAKVLLPLLVLGFIDLIGELWFGSMATSVAFIVSISVPLTTLSTLLLHIIIALSWPHRWMWLVASAALDTFRFGMHDFGWVLSGVYSCVCRSGKSTLNCNVSCLEHESIGCHQLRELCRRLLTIRSSISMWVTCWHGSTHLILLIEASTGMTCLPIINSFLNEHLTHW